MTQQISLTLSEELLEASAEYSKEYGYSNVQELLKDLLRKKVLLENAERYKKIEDKMAKSKGIKKLSQEKSLQFLEKL